MTSAQSRFGIEWSTAILVLVASASGQPAQVAQADDKAGAVTAGAKVETAPWSVSSPPGEMVEAVIDTSEGTWVNLDVSPDGNEIVFDLLGDLYTIPMTGGEARALTSGIEWDMQPRYSPDGKRIAFTSDRTGEGGKGGDNIWVINRDGTEPRQVTKETFRLLNSPCWTPDGEYIAARKHFTSRRSLGAGEIWLYHRTGSDGLQMTTRPTEQKDVGEPAFSPDGRYLYYSLDSTPGGAFDYNRDAGQGIYSIDRLDRVKGVTERLITGPGGAIRPTPSPDGASLAFIRRDRFKTCLYVLDLASNTPRKLYDSLERDMQETWAVHGVYPTMAWTPDSREIVFWAGGGLHRIDAATGEVRAIPFHVTSSRQVAKSLRRPIEVAPLTFDVKMLRGVRVSPAGDRVAYQALGHIYVRDLPDGSPRRLTAQSDHFEFFPSFSRDGKWIVYATWNDEAFGTVRAAPASGGDGRVVTREPGHYVDPVFTPDGSQVVYGKVSGGWLTTPVWSRDAGLYRVRIDGGEPKLISKRGTHPQFAAASDRVYVMTVEEQKDADRRCLISMNLDGGEERTHLVSENATEFAVSPDGKWVAFAERFNAYVAPLVATGREVSIGPKATSLPIARVSSEAGMDLHWSGDSRALLWALGPELFTRRLEDSLAFVDRAPDPLPEAPATGVNIGFQQRYDAPEGTMALVGARLVTMRGDEVIENGTVVVAGNRIAAIGPSSSVAVPAGALTVDVSGKTIMPGMIDVHAHGALGENGMTPQKNWGQYANLAFGVTTIHDPSNDTGATFAASELAKAGMVVAPRIFSTGTILYGAAGTAKAEIDSLDDAMFHLRRMQAVGAFSVKSYNQPRRDQRQQVIEAARRLGMMVVPEGGSLLEHDLTMVVDGHTGVEHSLPVERVYSDVTQLWAASQTGYTPTLIVGYGGIMGENYWYDRTNVWEDQHLLTFVPKAIVDPRSRRRTKAPDEDYNTLRSAAICKELVDSGCRVQLGAHGQLAGLGAHWELWMLAQGGLTPMQCIRAATLDGAFYLGLDGDLGSLEAGKLADLIVLEANPLDDIRNSTSIQNTMLNGRLYDSRTMARLGPDALPKPVFFFEGLQGGVGMRSIESGGCAGCGLPGMGCGPMEADPHRHAGYR
ncbi:MAG: PD40 domain-containing protein [Phycisphaeraceae bacterium]|nr:PD40 domain-containing protein [Phycisphaeraceae bacterium]